MWLESSRHVHPKKDKNIYIFLIFVVIPGTDSCDKRCQTPAHFLSNFSFTFKGSHINPHMHTKPQFIRHWLIKQHNFIKPMFHSVLNCIIIYVLFIKNYYLIQQFPDIYCILKCFFPSVTIHTLSVGSSTEKQTSV